MSMLKKIIFSFSLAFALYTSAGAVQSMFPARLTDVNGQTHAGYLDEDGKTVLPFIYQNASDFAACGLAAVQNNKQQTAVINEAGKFIVPYVESPKEVAFSEDSIAFRYAGYSVYYTLDGKKIGQYNGAQGFFSDGLLCCQTADDTYTYVRQDSSSAFTDTFKQAGAFSNGLALVCTTNGVYQVMNTSGQVFYIIPPELTPVYMTIFEKDCVVVTKDGKQALYSLSQQKCLTPFQFNNISPFQDGTAMAKENGLWGIINKQGKYLTQPTYHYLSYMGEDLYAARSADGSVAAVDANGNTIYRTTSYMGGFDELRYGLSWHGMTNGSLIFFHKNGGYFASLSNAENPTLLSENVVRVTQDETTRYINLESGKILLEQPKTFDLGQGVTAETIHYERFIGYRADGTEYGWNIDFPTIGGSIHAEVAKQINAAIRSFFLNDSAGNAKTTAIQGGYGVSLQGSKLTVSGRFTRDDGAQVKQWEDQISFDIFSGIQLDK